MSPTSDVGAGVSRFYRPRIAFWLALILLVPFTALAISTFVLESAIIPGLAVFVAFPLIMLLHLMTIMKLTATLKLNAASKLKGSGIRSLRKLFPRWAQFVLLPFWLSAMSGMFGVGNAAEEKDGKFFVNDHGVERVVTKAEAMKGNRLELRLTSSIFGAFSALGLVVSLARRDELGSKGVNLNE
jgi:hypothetical protein